MMNKDIATKHKVIKLVPGFYAIRYACDESKGPIALLKSVPINKTGSVDVIGTKRDDSVMLSRDTPMALVHVSGAETTITISLLLPKGTKDAGATFDIERLRETLPKKAAAASASLVYLSGHVEWKGDTKAAPGTFLGKESGTARIEGFVVNWLKRPHNTDIKYGCTFGDQEETSTALGGGFVGSRQQAAPITSLWMELEGDEAEKLNLRYTAVFALSGHVTGRQAEVVSGTSQKDYLVGLWVSVDDANASPSVVKTSSGRNVKSLKTFRA